MLDTIIVAGIIAVASVFVARRIYRIFRSETPVCNCTGCGQNGTCPSSGEKGEPSCCSQR